MLDDWSPGSGLFHTKLLEITIFVLHLLSQSPTRGPSTCELPRLPVVLEVIIREELDALCSEGIGLSVARDIGVEDHVQRLAVIVHRPGRIARVSVLPAVGVQVVNEADPGRGHEIAEIEEILALVLEWVDRVTQTFLRLSASETQNGNVTWLTFETAQDE